jgi:uncharacterized protein YraI
MLNKALTIAAVVAALFPAVVLADAPATGYVGGRTKIYAGPDTGYPVVSMVRRGEGVEIHGCLSDRSWCDVGFMHTRGWMSGRSILGDSVRGRVPVSTMDNSNYGDTRFNLDEYWDTHYNGRYDNRRSHWQDYWHQRDRD